jgi:hypothetical protein
MNVRSPEYGDPFLLSERDTPRNFRGVFFAILVVKRSRKRTAETQRKPLYPLKIEDRGSKIARTPKPYFSLLPSHF